MVCDSASLSVMLEGVGHFNSRWMQIKREEFTALEESKRAGTNKRTPRCIKHQESRLQHAISSLSSSSDDFSKSSEQETTDSSPILVKSIKLSHLPTEGTLIGPKNATEKSFSGDHPKRANKASPSDSSDASNNNCMNNIIMRDASKDFHDYNAMPLPDPKIGYNNNNNNTQRNSSGGSSLSEDSPEESNTKNCNGDGNNNNNTTKRPNSTDSSSGDDSVEPPPAAKRRKADDAMNDAPRPDGAKSAASLSQQQWSTTSSTALLPPSIAKKGGISHNVRPTAEPAASSNIGNGASRLQVAPAIVLPPFSGLGKRPCVAAAAAAVNSSAGAPLSVKSDTMTTSMHSSNTMYNNAKQGPTIISADVESSSCSEEDDCMQIRANYHINEDDRILMDDVLMCPFMFRSQGAILCGSVTETVMPGMLRAHFSARNKLQSLELVYDAMGFMQQLARASGNEGTAQIVPGSVEMALTPTTTEARVITMAQPPYLVMNVNEVWSRITGYTQMDVEGKAYFSLLEGEGTIAAAKERPCKPPHNLESVAKGRPACSTNIHYGKDGSDFIEFVCSYPLTNESDEITHILHVSKELPSSFRDCEFE